MFTAFFLSLGQLGDARIVRVFIKSMAVTLAVFAVLGVATWWGVRALIARWSPESAGGFAAAATVVILGLALWLLFRAIAVAVIGVFADEVVEAVEARHYPAALATARPVPFARSAAMGLGSAGRVVAVNALLSPLYLLLLATGIGTAAAFLLVNGWLLGRDLGDMVAARYFDRAGLIQWRRRTHGRRFLLGLADAVLFLVPVVAFVAPVLGAAMATHMFHRDKT